MSAPTAPAFPTREELTSVMEDIQRSVKFFSSSEEMTNVFALLLLNSSINRLAEAIETLAFETHAGHHRAGHTPQSSHPAHGFDAEATEDED